MEYEYCVICGGKTDRAGEDSIYCDDCNKGPLCEVCWSEHEGNAAQCIYGKLERLDNELGDPDRLLPGGK